MGEVARRIGKPLMPWQQDVIDVVLEIDPATGLLAYDQFGLTVPRQSGKSTLLLAKAVHRSVATGFFGPRQNIVYTAQTRKDSRDKFEKDFAPDLAASRVFRPPAVVPHWGNGNEHIKFSNGSRFKIEATTEKAGHGGTIDEAYIDEAFAHVDNRSEDAFRPAMITRKNKQLGWISTAGWLNGSPYLEGKVVQGRAAVERESRSGLAYFEWSADPDADPEDPEVWRGCMPALGHTITEAAIRGELEAMRSNINGFRRAFLNQWVPKDAPDADIIDIALWASLMDPASQAEALGGFGFDVQPKNLSASVTVAGLRADGFTHLEVLRNDSGTDWCVPYLVERWRRWHKPVAIDPASPAGAFIDELERQGVTVQRVGGHEYAAACQSFVTEVLATRVRHQGWPTLTAALGAAQKRDIGDGGWGWARKKVDADISSLVAATLALHALQHPLPPRGGSFVSF